MTSQNTQPEEQIAVEDLTVSETETATVKGGAGTDYLLLIDGVKGESASTPPRR